MVKERREFGLAVVGCGTIGRIRAMLARNYPGVGWLGLCDIKEDLGRELADDTQADFFAADFNELLARPEVDAAIIATDENNHVEPTLAAVENGHALFIEKPLATDAVESQRVYDAIVAAGVDAVVGYTNRFRRRFLAVKERLVTGQIGDVTGVVTRAFMNRMVPIATVQRTNQRVHLTPMVVSGTHALDMSMWLMEGKTPASVYACSNDTALSQYGTKDSTFGIFTMSDGTIWSMNISWALPAVWPGAVYGLEIGIVGTKGVIDIDDTHRDLVLASEVAQGAGYNPEGFEPEYKRHVDFLTSYPPGDIHAGQLWGPMREETNAWLSRVYTGLDTPHATAADGHRNLLLTMAMDHSAARGEKIALPVDPAELGPRPDLTEPAGAGRRSKDR
jgi:myo-inositol 2-dehydrogenase/D-chiro-inositol 1-dehydrogenase